MGWRPRSFSQVVKSVAKVGNYVDPHAIAINALRTRLLPKKTAANIEGNATLGLAQYGGIAGTVLQVVPVFGTALGGALIVGSAAANVKLRQDAIAKQKREQQIADAQIVADTRQAYADAGYSPSQQAEIEAGREPTPNAPAATPASAAQSAAQLGATVNNLYSDAVTAAGTPVAGSAFAPASLLPASLAPRTPSEAGAGPTGEPVTMGQPMPMNRTWQYIAIGAAVVGAVVGVLLLLRRK